MPESDADQEGVTLPAILAARMVARAEAERAIREHLRECPLARDDVLRRVRTLEISFARLIGVMIGSGVLGGGVGASVVRVLWG